MNDKKLSDKEIALELVKLLSPTTSSSTNSFKNNADAIAKAYNSILKSISK